MLSHLTTAFVAVLLISNVAGLKVFSAFGLVFDGGALIFPLAYIFGDVLTEVYGYAATRRVIWTGFFWLIVYNLVVTVCLSLNDLGPTPFNQVFAYSPRLLAGGILGFLWGEFANSFVLAKLKLATHGKHLWMRTIGSTVVGELIDTLIFCTIAYAGTMAAGQFWNYVVTGYLLKTAVEVLMTPVTYQVVGYLKKVDGEVWDEHTDFSPFRL